MKGGSYLLDVNNKIVIIGGSFKNPVIHYVMAINADNATNAQEIKEVIFAHEHLKSLTAREASRRLEIYETYFGQEVVRIYDGQDFGYSSQSTDLYARLPEGFASYGYTGTQRDGGGVSAEDGGTGGYNSFINIVDSHGQLQGHAFELNNKIVIINSDFEFYSVEAVLVFDETTDGDIDDEIKQLKEILKNATFNTRKKGTQQDVISIFKLVAGPKLSGQFERRDYIGFGDYLSRKTAYRNAQTDRGYSGEISDKRGNLQTVGSFSKRTENGLRSLNAQYIYAEKESTVREALEETADIIIFTADCCYLVSATGYLQGQIIIKESNWKKDSKLKRILEAWENGIIKNDITSDRGIAIIRSNGRRGIRNIRISQNGGTTGRTLSLDGGKSKRDNVGDNSSGIHHREKLRNFGELDKQYLQLISSLFDNFANGNQQKADEVYQKLDDLVRRAAAAAGYTEVWYHGTNEDWNEYDLSKNNPMHAQYGEGIYLAKSPGSARMYGDIVKKLYVKSGLSYREAKKSGGTKGHLRAKKDGREIGIMVVYDPSQIKSADVIVQGDDANR